MVLGRRLGAVGLIALALGWTSLCPLDSRADDFQVNSYTTDAQAVPAVSMDPAGNVVVTWVSYGSPGNDQSFTSILARIFGPTGAPLGDDFQVNTLTDNTQRWPSVARGAAGNFIIVWDSLAVSPTSIRAQRYGPDGTPAGGEFTVNSSPFGGSYPVVAMDAAENFVVAWRGATGRVFDADGTPRGPDFQAGNPGPLQLDRRTSVAMAPGGDFVVAWEREEMNGPAGTGNVFFRRYSPDGVPLAPESQVNTSAVFAYGQPPGVAVAPDGSFVVVWPALGYGNDRDIVGRRFAADGAPLTDEFPVNTHATSFQEFPAISMNANGEFMAVWTSYSGSTGNDPDLSINARRFAADATPTTPEFQVNTVTAGWQISPAVVHGTDGRFVVVWRSATSEGGDTDSIQASGIADLQVTVDDGVGQVYPTGPVTYTVAVTNPPGTGRVAGARVEDVFPAALSCAWTCAASPGGWCTAGPVSGSIDDTVTLPLGGTLTYTASCTVSSTASGTIVNTATVTPPLNVSDFFSGNNSATDVDGVAEALLIDDVTVLEGNAGTTTATFMVSLTGPMAVPVTVDYATADGTATAADNDYTPASGTLSFAPGETAKPVPIGVLGDVTFEADETFTVTLSNATGGALIGDGLGVGTILNDDAALPSGSLDELVHGSVATKDLQTAAGPAGIAQEWRIAQRAHASYEVVVDAVTGDLGPDGPALDRLGSDGSVVQSAVGLSGGSSRSLRWENGATADVDQRIRVQSRGCILDCDAGDTFRVRFFETTLSGARFNNTGTQRTPVIVANTSGETVSGHIDSWDPSGQLLLSQAFTTLPHGVYVMSPNALLGQAGSLSVSHDGSYGALVGKAVALEPATGFTFDTPLQPRPR